MPLELFIAWRYLKARRNGVFTLLTTVIAVGGITLGVAALIITLSVMSGFHKDIREKILGLQPHITVVRQGMEFFENHEDVEGIIRGETEVTSTAPFMYGQIILRNGQYTQGAVVKGVDWRKEDALIHIQRITAGNNGALNDNQIVLGKELAAMIHARAGDDIVLMFPGPVSMVPKMGKFKVAGIFHSGMYEYDANLAYITLAAGQKLWDSGGAVTGIGVAIRDAEKVQLVEKSLQETLGYPFLARSWERMNRNLFAALKLEKIMMFIILTLIILVAAFNIISNLLLLTVEKAKDIGILSAMGISRVKIGAIFMFEGLIVGLSGIVSGAVLGIGISLALKKYQFIHLPADVYYIDTLPVRILAADITGVLAATIIITLLACIYPAYQATKLDPLDAIRYG